MNLEELRTIPKVELHRHLECSVRSSTLLELAQIHFKKKYSSDSIASEFLILEPMRDLAAVLNKFLKTQSLLSSPEVLTRITHEANQDAFAEGIRILELRWSPTFIAEGHPELNLDSIIKAIRKGQALAGNLPMAVGHIAIIQRTRPLAEAERIIDFAIENRDFFVGVDLADNEEGFDPKPFQKAFEKARSHGLHVTIHAGESPSPQASLNVKNSIEYLGAERIGHGIQIVDDPFVCQLVRQKSIPLEISLKSNWLTSACDSYSGHPLRRLIDSGILVTLNTDDPGVFGTDLPQEYSLSMQYQNLNLDEIHRCNDIAADRSFIPLIKKQKFWPRPIHRVGS